MLKTIHKLKTWPMYFQEVKEGIKKFELRKNDRNFQVGDRIILQEYILPEERFTGDEYEVEITYICKPVELKGLEEGYVILGIEQ